MNGTSVLIKIKTDSQRALSVLPTCEDTMKSLPLGRENSLDCAGTLSQTSSFQNWEK